MLLGYDEYVNYPFAKSVTAAEFDEYAAYAEIYVTREIERIVGKWNTVEISQYSGEKLLAVKEAIALQVNFMLANGIADGVNVTNVSLEGYSQSVGKSAEFSEAAGIVLRREFAAACWL